MLASMTREGTLPERVWSNPPERVSMKMPPLTRRPCARRVYCRLSRSNEHRRAALLSSAGPRGWRRALHWVFVILQSINENRTGLATDLVTKDKIPRKRKASLARRRSAEHGGKNKSISKPALAR